MSSLRSLFYCKLFLKHYGCVSDIVNVLNRIYLFLLLRRLSTFFSRFPLLGQEMIRFRIPPETPGYQSRRWGRGGGNVDSLAVMFSSRCAGEGLVSKAGRSYIPSSFVCKIRLLQKRVCRLMAGSKLLRRARAASACQV